MFFITMLERLPGENKNHLSGFGSQWTCGYCVSLDAAAEILHYNEVNVRDGRYDYAVVEFFPEGVLPTCKGRHWYAWDKLRRGFFEIKEPAAMSQIHHFAMG